MKKKLPSELDILRTMKYQGNEFTVHKYKYSHDRMRAHLKKLAKKDEPLIKFLGFRHDTIVYGSV